MHADVPNHEPSLMLMNCGEARLIRPSFGSWVTYGLGSENQNLPGFIAMCPGGYPIQETQNWQSAFLPGVYQGTYIDTRHTDLERLIENIRNTAVSPAEQRQQLDLLQQLNQRHLEQRRQRCAAGSAHPIVRAGLRHAARRRGRLRHQPRAAAHSRYVWPRRAGPATSDRPAAARKGRALRAGLARRRASRGTITTTSKSTIAGSPANAIRPSPLCSRI